MAFWDTVKTYLDKGVEASKDALTKANSAANDFGNTSKLKIEIQQLKSKRNKNSVKLGGIVLEAFLNGAESIAASDEAVKAVLDSVKAIDTDIAAKQKLLEDAAAQKKAAKEAAASQKEAATPAPEQSEEAVQTEAEPVAENAAESSEEPTESDSAQ